MLLDGDDGPRGRRWAFGGAAALAGSLLLGLLALGVPAPHRSLPGPAAPVELAGPDAGVRPAPPACAGECPFGGAFDGRNCLLAEAPAGAHPFLRGRAFYYEAAKDVPGAPCPYRAGPWEATLDGGACRLAIPAPAGAVPFLFRGRFYFARCGQPPDFGGSP